MSYFNISPTEYAQYKEIALNIKNEIAGYLGVSVNKIHWDDFYHLLKEKYRIIFYPDDKFYGIAAQTLAGSITSDGQNTVIDYNNTNVQSTSRKHFTLVHEGVHFFCDLKKGKKAQLINDSIKNEMVQEKRVIIEKRAETVASLIMCSNYELSLNIKNGKNLDDLCNHFGMSRAAIWYRIRNYLRFELKLPDNRARILASAYCYPSDNTERAKFLGILLRHWDSLIDNLNKWCSPTLTQLSNLINNWHETILTQSAFYQLKYLIEDMYATHGNYCIHCKATCFYKNFCPICGNRLQRAARNQIENFWRLTKLNEINVNNQCIAMKCPVCGFDNTKFSYFICPMCGAYLQNICTGITLKRYYELVLCTPETYKVVDSWIADFGNLSDFNGAIPGQEIIKGIDESLHDQDNNPYPHDNIRLLPGYARFCPLCGCISSFYLEGILKVEKKNN